MVAATAVVWLGQGLVRVAAAITVAAATMALWQELGVAATLAVWQEQGVLMVAAAAAATAAAQGQQRRAEPSLRCPPTALCRSTRRCCWVSVRAWRCACRCICMQSRGARMEMCICMQHREFDVCMTALLGERARVEMCICM